jgi:hypothetical protein
MQSVVSPFGHPLSTWKIYDLDELKILTNSDAMLNLSQLKVHLHWHDFAGNFALSLHV